MHRRNVIALALISLILVATGRISPAPATNTEAQQQALLARIAALETLIPDQAHIMADVGDHFTNLWFAGGAENWPLAEFYLNETKSHLRWAVRAKPIRKDNQGRDINLGNILEAFENSQLTQLKQAIDGKNRGAFERVYKEALPSATPATRRRTSPTCAPRSRPSPRHASSTSIRRPSGHSDRPSKRRAGNLPVQSRPNPTKAPHGLMANTRTLAA